MRLNVASVAFWATFSSLSMVQAQSLASVGGPRELPPASFTGQQYVDSRGCVFLKAGYGGQTTWVPRVNAQRKALCGFPPTFAKVQIEIADEAPAPAPRVVVAAPAPVPAAPAPQVRTATIDPATYTPAPYVPPGATVRTAPAPTVRVTAPAPYTDRAPKGTYEVASSGPGPGKIGCFTSAPVAEVVRLRNGGTAVVCTRGDGGVSGWRSPIYPNGSPPGVALTDPVGRGTVTRVAQDPAGIAARPASSTTYVATASVPKPPKGYKLAWTDDRLNPRRGLGTAEGMAAQDRIWTREVPARLVADQPRKKAQVTVSTKSAPSQPAARQPGTTRGALVQVGTFGVPANADGAAARLSALGLPVARGRTTKSGKALQIVFAGPFANGAEAQAALSAARRAGFPDAFVR